MNRSYPKTFFFYKHQKKADAFEKALRQFGWQENRSIANTSVALFDVDILSRVEIFNSLHGRGVKLFCYPHSGAPAGGTLNWRGHKAHPHTLAQFVFSPGHEEILRVIGYPHDIHVVGWAYCELLPYKPVEHVRSVLFGPLHPNANGWMSESDRAVNQRAFERLIKASKEMGFSITVRYLHTLEGNGLERVDEPNIMWTQGSPDNSYQQIDEHDIVVSTQTLAYMSVARGKPTLMMDEWIAPRAGNKPEMYQHVDRWDEFKHIMMFPHDINTTSDVPALIRRVAQDGSDIQTWKERMIGTQFNPKKFSEIVESYLPLGEQRFQERVA